MRIHNFRLKSLNRILRTCCDREDFVRGELIDIFNNNKQRFFDIADDCNIKDKTFIDFFKHKKRFPLYIINTLISKVKKRNASDKFTGKVFELPKTNSNNFFSLN